MDSIICKTPSETEQYGRNLAATCKGGEVFGLRGELGAGKTVLVKGLGHGLGYIRDVTSPTFSVLHEYIGGRLPLYHFDLYRLEAGEERYRLGLDDYLYGDGVCVVEWPDRVPGLLPSHTQFLEFTIVSETDRRIVCSSVC